MFMFWQSLLKSVDNVFRLFSPYIKRRKIKGNKGAKILIIRPGGGGDAILLTPALKMFKENLPNSEIHFLGEKRNIDFAKFCYGDIIEQFFVYDSFSFPFFVMKNLGRYDFVLDTEQFFVLPAIFARILGKASIGFSTKAHILDFSLDYFHFSFEAFEFFRLFYFAMSIISGSPDSDMKKIDEEFQNYFPISISGLKNYDVDVLVAPFTTKKEKIYDRFREITESLSKKYKIVVLGEKKIDIYELFSLVNSAKLFVGVDNAILHIAELLGKPSVAIFGPTNHLKWAYTKNTVVVRSNTWCSPCSYFAEISRCPRNVECMKRIEPSMVISIVESLLN